MLSVTICNGSSLLHAFLMSLWTKCRILCVFHRINDTHVCTGEFNRRSFNLGFELCKEQVGFPLGPLIKKKLIKIKKRKRINHISFILGSQDTWQRMKTKQRLKMSTSLCPFTSFHRQNQPTTCCLNEADRLMLTILLVNACHDKSRAFCAVKINHEL